MNDDTRIRWQAGALLILIYMAGTITGGALVYAGMRIGAAGRSPLLLQPGRGATVIGVNGGLPIAYGDLDLSADQRRAIERIIAESRPHTDSILRLTLPALRLATDSMQARMRAVLTPDQRRRLDEQGPRLRQPGLGDPGPVIVGPGPPP
jgi:hypothetical protein